MGDTRIEALDNSLFDKLQVFDGDTVSYTHLDVYKRQEQQS